jgi:hypothetical protein
MNKLIIILATTFPLNAIANEELVKFEEVEHNGIKITIPTVLVNGEVCKTFVSSSTASSFNLAQICDRPNKSKEPLGLEDFRWNEETGMHEFHLKTGRIVDL